MIFSGVLRGRQLSQAGRIFVEPSQYTRETGSGGMGNLAVKLPQMRLARERRRQPRVMGYRNGIETGIHALDRFCNHMADGIAVVHRHMPDTVSALDRKGVTGRQNLSSIRHQRRVWRRPRLPDRDKV
jgi:hypothetical protein